MSHKIVLAVLLVAAISLASANDVEPRYLGCFVDSPNRVLPKLAGAGPMSASKCFTLCQDYPYFGLQNGNECWCGSSNNAFQAAAASDCSMRCSGDSSTVCGGPWRNSIYGNPNVLKPKYLGCFVDSPNRVLPKLAGAGPMSSAKCYSLCTEYPYFGLQNGNECWCGSSNSAFQPAAASDCSMRCSGDSSTVCGGPWRNSIYSSGLETITVTSTYLGCFVDSPNRVLPKLAGAGPMSASNCLSLCKDYVYFGLQNGNECWCGSSNSKFQPAAASDCSMRCSGDSNAVCGGPWRNSIYTTGS